jgi:aminomethyltransferase
MEGCNVDGRKTPLYESHQESGAKIVEFGGWLMPVQYSGIIEEHHAVRTKAGLFDVSHMGEFIVKGAEAATFINTVITNDVRQLAVGQILYSPMCYADGGVVDDLLVYRLGEEEYLLVVNAGNIEKDFEWLEQHRADFRIELENLSDKIAEVALQGPAANAILSRLTEVNLADINYYWLKQDVMVAGVRCLISRTGYTGEDGFEIYCSAGEAVTLWRAILEAGKDYGLIPAGLGARDTLRFEACLPLYGHELSAAVTPLEAGLKPFIKFEKGEFIGSGALNAEYQTGVQRKLVGLEMTGRGIARAGHVCMIDGKSIGIVTSGTYAPTLGKNLALALLDIAYTTIGTPVQVDIRGKLVDAVVAAKPFYRRNKK